ncbi:MAG: septum formation family protein [Nocardioides sp.]
MRRLVALVCAAVVLSGCTSGVDDSGGSTGLTAESPSSGPGTTAGGEPTAPRSTPPAPPSPACYRLTLEQLTRQSNRSRPVPCTGRHDAQTIHVGRLAKGADGETVPVDSDRARIQQARTCQRRLAAFVGGTREDRDLSRFVVVWFSPTPAQAERGADWFRCDLVALGGGETLHRLPPPRRASGILDRDGLATYGLCGTAEPGTPAFERVICGRRHSWRAVGTIRLPGTERYPGAARTRRLGDQPCRDRVRALADDPLAFEYGWEWPTRTQWEDGQRYGYCWRPS